MAVGDRRLAADDGCDRGGGIAVLSTVLPPGLPQAASISVISSHPLSTLAATGLLAVTVGFVAGTERFLYGIRNHLVPARVWVREPFDRRTRVWLAAVGFALLPVGSVVGHAVFTPQVVSAVLPAGAVISMLTYAGLVWGVSIATGIATQAALVVGVVAMSRRLGPDSTAGPGA